MNGEHEHCAGLVRAGSRDRYLAALLAPAKARDHLMALYALDVELAEIREKITEPLAGEIRLQWWRDAIAALYRGAAGEGRGHPVVRALAPAIEAGRLPQPAFEQLIDTRQFDVHQDKTLSFGELEAYLGATEGAVFQLVCLILSGGENPGSGTAAGHAGMATGLAFLLRALPRHAARGKLYLPADLLARHGASDEELFQGRMSPELAAALEEVRGIARQHLAAARGEAGKLPRALRPAFAPAALVPAYLRASERVNDPLHEVVDIHPLTRVWRIWRAARWGL